jgi:2-dehydro-3-deoxygalactonokinase
MALSEPNGRLIAVDWGTTRLRARVLQSGATDGERDGPPRVSEPWGIASVTDGDFAGVLRRVLSALGEEEMWGREQRAGGVAPILMSGMIGSLQGWVEAPYARCPAPLAGLARQLTPVPFDRPVQLVPGVCRDDGGMPDVMRGEETQILGALDDPSGSGLFVLPGTHSKWALVEEGRLTSFMTFMSGEVFAAMRDHSLLSRTIERRATPPAPEDPAFAAGAAAGIDPDPAAGGLLHRLFGVRTRGLFDRLDGSDQEAFLSGLVIGSEAREATAALNARTSGTLDGARVVILGDGPLVGLYQGALEAQGAVQGWTPEPWSHDSAFAGLDRIARAAGLLR